MDDPTTARSPTVLDERATTPGEPGTDGLGSEPHLTRHARRPHGVSVTFRYLDRTDAWVPLVLPSADGRLVSAAQLVHLVVSEATARGVRSIGTALELAHPLTHDLLGALRRRLGTDLETVDTRCAGSSVMVTARLLAPRLAHCAPDVVTGRGPDTHDRRPTAVLAR